MKRLIKLLTLDKEFVFAGKQEDLMMLLKNSKDVNYEVLSDNEVQFTPDISWGTMSIGAGFSVGIKVNAILADREVDRVNVNFRTSIRPEHYFLIVVFVIFFVGIIFSNEPKWLILALFGLWIVCHAWFHFIYRLQETSLVDKVVKKLRLLKT